MKKYCVVLIIIPLIFIQSCKYAFHEAFWRDNPVDSRSTNFRPIDLGEKDITVSKKYDVIIITDTHFGHKDYQPPQSAFLKWLSTYKDSEGKQPLFCITLGDLVDHGTASEYEELAAFLTKIEDSGVPVYNVLGNHDLYNSGYSLWKKTCYPHSPAYYFETDGFQWYFLDTASGTLGRPQFYALKDKLKSSTKPKMLFTHYPLYGDGIFYFCLSNPRERAELISLFGRTNVKLYCAGHYHKGRYYDFGAFQEHILEAFGQYSGWYVMHIDESDAHNPTFEIKKRH